MLDKRFAPVSVNDGYRREMGDGGIDHRAVPIAAVLPHVVAGRCRKATDSQRIICPLKT